MRQFSADGSESQSATVVIDDFVYAMADLPPLVARLLKQAERLERDLRRHQRRARQLQESYGQCQARLRYLLARSGVRPVRVVGY